MIIVKINELLKKQAKTVYWLSKQTGISNNNLSNMIKNKTESINFVVLNQICKVLKCEPGDILKYSED
jgi:putative transcriptional regulator